MKYLFAIVATLFCLLMLTACTPQNDNLVHINQVQVIGSHNSYKQVIERPVMEMILARDSTTIALDYAHLSIAEQLDLGIRSLELDVLHDPDGGRYKEPVALKLLKQNGGSPLPYDTLGQLSLPGLKTLHVPDIDFRSHCLLFKNCLQEVKAWSTAHPDHLPIIITINPKDSGVDTPGFTRVLPFTPAVLDSLDQEILAVFPADYLITPDAVKGGSASLREAVTTTGWPLLESSMGKVMFVLDAGAAITGMYVANGMAGKPMFPNVDASHRDAAFFIMNDPKKQQEDIKQSVAAGFMVRTRADADTREARTNDRSRLEAAIASGAQVISTDYYSAALSPTGKFHVSFSDGKFQRCNPLNSPSDCTL